MHDYGRRLVVDSTFDRTVRKTIAALESEGLDVIGRFDVREYAEQKLHHDFRRYVLLQALPARLAVEALRHDLDVGTLLPVTIALYELADGETAVVAAEPFAALQCDLAWEASAPELAALAAETSEWVARALARVGHRTPNAAAVGSA